LTPKPPHAWNALLAVLFPFGGLKPAVPRRVFLARKKSPRGGFGACVGISRVG
jgi:hypothetical protein